MSAERALFLSDAVLSLVRADQADRLDMALIEREAQPLLELKEDPAAGDRLRQLLRGH